MSDDVKHTDSSTGTVPSSVEPASGQSPGTPRWREWGAVAAAIVTYLLLADATAETYLAASPVRWWVVGIAGVYLLLTIGVAMIAPRLWLGINWSTKAAVSSVLLLAVLTSTAWLPNGLTDGVRLGFRPTSTVFSLATLAAILFASLLIIRVEFTPLPARFAVVTLGVYGAAAFGWGIWTGTPFVDLFGGRSLWSQLPPWLQGAFVGGLVVVPSAILLELIRGVRHVRGRELRRWGQQLIVLALCFQLSAAAYRTPPLSGGRPVADSRSTDTVSNQAGSRVDSHPVGDLRGPSLQRNRALRCRLIPCRYLLPVAQRRAPSVYSTKT